jgi:hypothetical protein
LFEIGEKCGNFGVLMTQFFDLLYGVTNGRVISMIIEAANRRRRPAANATGQIHCNLPIEDQRL